MFQPIYCLFPILFIVLVLVLTIGVIFTRRRNIEQVEPPFQSFARFLRLLEGVPPTSYDVNALTVQVNGHLEPLPMEPESTSDVISQSAPSSKSSTWQLKLKHPNGNVELLKTLEENKPYRLADISGTPRTTTEELISLPQPGSRRFAMLRYENGNWNIIPEPGRRVRVCGKDYSGKVMLKNNDQIELDGGTVILIIEKE